MTSGDLLSSEQKEKEKSFSILNQKTPEMCIQKISLQYSILLLWHSFHLYMLVGSPLIIKYLMYF